MSCRIWLCKGKGSPPNYVASKPTYSPTYLAKVPRPPPGGTKSQLIPPEFSSLSATWSDLEVVWLSMWPTDCLSNLCRHICAVEPLLPIFSLSIQTALLLPGPAWEVAEFKSSEFSPEAWEPVPFESSDKPQSSFRYSIESWECAPEPIADAALVGAFNTDKNEDAGRRRRRPVSTADEGTETLHGKATRASGMQSSAPECAVDALVWLNCCRGWLVSACGLSNSL